MDDPRMRPARRRSGPAAAALAALVVVAGACSSNSSTTATTAAPVTTKADTATTAKSKKTTTTEDSDATDDTTGSEPEETTTTAKRATSTSKAGGASGAKLTREQICELLSSADVQAATGVESTKASTARDHGCRWENGSTPVVDVDYETPSDPATSFSNGRTIYGDETRADLVAGIGDDAYLHGLDEKVVFRKGDTIWTVWVQVKPESGTKADASVALARKVADQV